MSLVDDRRVPPAAADGGALTRRVTMAPGMCGSSGLVFGQMGDWTWEAVAAASGVNVYQASDAAGRPTYLSFYYIEARGTGTAHPHGITFGDELDVTSRCFDLGSESILTLHRLTQAGALTDPRVLEADEFSGPGHPDALYVRILNRWISRSAEDSNEGLLAASPEGFRHDRLASLPAGRSPRADASRGRRDGSFHPDSVPGHHLVVPDTTLTREVDVVHDLNAVGLLYFASYFSMVDSGVLQVWRAAGGDTRQFLGRRVLHQRIGYYGNADPDAVLDITARLLRRDHRPGEHIADVTVRDAADGRLLAVSSVRFVAETA